MRSPVRLLALSVQLVAILVVYVATVASGEEFDLAPRIPADDLTHVKLELEVGGDLKTLADPADDATVQKSKLPLSVKASLEYDQRLLAADERMAARYYREAEAEVKIDGQPHAPGLAPEHRLLVFRVEKTGRTEVASPAGLLTREEIDLVNHVGNTLAVDALLPKQPVGESDSWSHDAATMGCLLGLDTVAVCEVESVIEKSDQRYVQMRMAGTVHGSCDGSATEISVKGVYRYDRRRRRVTGFNLAVKENRTAGSATPGLDVVAKVRLAIKPIKSSDELASARLAKLDTSAAAFAKPLRYEARRQGFRFEHDPTWFVTSEDREAVTIRQMVDGSLVAHCTISRLPAKSPQNATTLEQFQKDIRFSLGETFGQFVGAREWRSEQGYHCYRVVARGKADDVPVEWHYYLVASDAGERASLAVTMEGPDAKRLGNADLKLVEALKLAEPVSAETLQAEQEAAEKESHRTAQKSRPSNSSRSASRRQPSAPRLR